MRKDREVARFVRVAHAIAFALILAGGIPSCNRPSAGVYEEGGEAGGAGESSSAEAEAPAASIENEVSYLDPLTCAPWLGHADDGSLIKVEFFAAPGSSSTLCRTNIKHAFGGAPIMKSPFTASSELANITWDKGKSRGTYDPETQTVTASVASRARTHHVVLRQVSAESLPGLASFRTSIPDDQTTQAVHQKFLAMLKEGRRWWKSGEHWDKLVTPDDLKAVGQPIAFIRPAAKTPPKFPQIEPGGHFDFPIECHLPPGSAIPDAETTIGIVAELHHAGDVQTTWLLNLLNPGALVQELKAQWFAPKGVPGPAGPATIFIYLTKSRGEGDAKSTDINQPLSNLLKIEIEFAK